MITLAQAFRLCDIGEEAIYLQAADDETHREHYFWSKKVRARLDLKKIKVVRIRPLWEQYGPDYLGLLFIVRGITGQELQQESLYEQSM